MNSRTNKSTSELVAILGDSRERKQHTPMEICFMLHDLLEAKRWNYAQASRHLKWSDSQIIHYMDLATETPTTQSLLGRTGYGGMHNNDNDLLTQTHAYQIRRSVSDPLQREVLALKAYAEGLTADQTGEMAAIYIALEEDKKSSFLREPYIKYTGLQPKKTSKPAAPKETPASPQEVMTTALVATLGKRVQAATTSVEIFATLAKWMTEEVEKLQAALSE